MVSQQYQEKSIFHNSIVQVENVQRHLPQGGRELHILNGVTFDVGAGSWLTLTGPSGSGKSTLLGILGGIDRPSAGRVFIEGIEISAMPEAKLSRLRNEKIGVAFQAFHLIPTMTALENVEAPLYIHPEKLRARSMAERMLKHERFGSPRFLDGVHHVLRRMKDKGILGPSLEVLDALEGPYREDTVPWAAERALAMLFRRPKYLVQEYAH